MIPHLASPVSATAPLRLRVESRPSLWSPGVALPVALDSVPALSWVVPLTHDGQRQAGYRIRAVRRTPDDTGAVLWDSGDISSERNSGVRWAGDPLRPHDAVEWAVMTIDESGAESGWSEPAAFAVPPLTASDWVAEWISVAPARAAATAFSDDRPVQSAILHIAAQGLVRIVLDGVCVNDGARDPSDTSLRRVVSRSYDVTDALSTDREHVLALVGARGHLHRVIDRVRLLAELHITFDDGTRRVIATDGSWQERDTTLVAEDPFHAELHDCLRGQRWMGQATPGDEPVRSGPGLDAPGRIGLPDTIEPDAGPPVRAVRAVPAERIDAPGGVALFDIGENAAARSLVIISGTTPGQRITVVHGEMLENGRVSTTNVTLPDDRDRERQIIEWTCGHTGQERIEPWFAIHGFRYLEVRGLGEAVIERVEARVTHSDVPVTGTFHSSDPLLDRMVETAVRTQLNNTHAHPEDCPTREQAGWTGDAAVSAEAALCHLDMDGVYRNWLADVALDQRDDGGILGVSPFLLGRDQMQPADPVWGAALTEIPLQHWLATGDTRLIERLLPAIRRWADWQYATTTDGLVTHADISYGADWLAIEQTPPVLLQTAAAEQSLRTVARFEAALGDEDAAAARRAQADELRAAARARLWDPRTVTWGNGSQASFGAAITVGWVEDDERDAVASRLRALVRAADGRIRSGYAGTQALVRALGSIPAGSGLLLDCVREPNQPGIGSMLVEGPGTFWETWWIHEPTVGIGSLDHIGLAGPFAAWAWTHIGGLRPLEPGYRTFAVDPRPDQRITSAHVTRWTPRGLIEVRWTRGTEALDLEITVPVGAECALPDGRVLPSGGHRVSIPVAPNPIPIDAAPEAPAHTLWLGEGADSGIWTGDGATITPIDEPWVCYPVFHEPLAPPIRLIEVHEVHRGARHTVAMTLPQPLMRSDADYVFASFDMDTGMLPGQRVIPFLVVIGAEGTRREAYTRWLPIAWNRVAVDLDDWPVDEPIVGLELGVHWTGEPDIARGAEQPVPDAVTDFIIRIGAVGASLGARTW